MQLLKLVSYIMGYSDSVSDKLLWDDVKEVWRNLHCK